MKYQKIANSLNNESNKSSQFRTRNWVETNDDVRSADKQYRFKTAMLRSSLCDYSDAYILVKENVLLNNTAGAGTSANNVNKKVIFKNCAPFTKYISKINNTQIDDAEYIDIVIPMYNLIEHSYNYTKTFGSLWQYCKDIPATNNADDIIDFTATDNTDSFKFEKKDQVRQLIMKK